MFSVHHEWEQRKLNLSGEFKARHGHQHPQTQNPPHSADTLVKR